MKKKLFRIVCVLTVLMSLSLAVASSAYSEGSQPYQELSVSFLDVGQGDAVLIQIPPDQVVLIDGGPRDSAASVLLPRLKKLGISKIDYLILSHAHLDHLFGLVELLEADQIQINHVWEPGTKSKTQAYRKFLRVIRDSKARYGHVREGTVIPLKETGTGVGVQITVLNPPVRALSGSRSPLNSNSIVIHLVYGERTFLFTGDIEMDSEQHLLENWGRYLKVDVLKVQHHGSLHSSCREFVQTVSPRYAIFMAGEGNPFSHPAPSVLDAYQQAGAEIFRTDLDGDVIFISDGIELSVSKAK